MYTYYMCIHTHIHICINSSGKRINTYIHTYILAYVRNNLKLEDVQTVLLHTYICVYIYIHTYIYIYTYIHTYIGEE